MVINNPDEFVQALGIDPSSYPGIKWFAGGAFAGLMNRYGEKKVPEGFVCGRTFKVQHKAVTLFDNRLEYPFELEDFVKLYLNES